MAVSSVVITIEGVLQKHVTSAPVPIGICLYHGLAGTFNVLLVSDQPRAEVDRWLALEGLTRHAAVEYNEGPIQAFDCEFRRLQQVNNLRNRGYSVDLVVEPNPYAAEKLLLHGFNTMVYIHADYALPQWRPDYEHKPKAWDSILRYQTEMAELKAIDARLTEPKKDYE